MSETDELNTLLLEVKQVAGPQSALLVEHLESARFYIVGAMPEEYQMSLEMAQTQLNAIPDRGVRAHVDNFLREHRKH